MSVYAGDTPQSDDLYLTFEQSKITRFAAFLGLPNRRLSQDDVTQSWMNLAKNFIGWKQSAPIGLRLLSALFALPINIALIPLKLLLSLIKIGTELIPGALGILTWMLSRAGAKLVLHKMNDEWCSFNPETGQSRPLLLKVLLKTLRFLRSVPILALSVSAVAVRFSFWMGHCLTSPIQSLNEAWYYGLQTSRLRGATYVTLTMISISWLYVITFPLAFKVIAATLLPLFLAHAPTAILSVLNTISQLCSPWLTVYGNLLITMTNHSLIPVLSKILGSTVGTMLSNFVASAPVAVGLGVIFGIFVGILPVIKDLLNFTLNSITHGIGSIFSRLTSRSARTIEVGVVDTPPVEPFIEPMAIEPADPSPVLSRTSTLCAQQSGFRQGASDRVEGACNTAENSSVKPIPVVEVAVLPVLLSPIVADLPECDSDSDPSLNADEKDQVSILSVESRARFFTPVFTERSLNRTQSNASESSWHTAVSVLSDRLGADEVERTTPGI